MILRPQAPLPRDESELGRNRSSKGARQPALCVLLLLLLLLVVVVVVPLSLLMLLLSIIAIVYSIFITVIAIFNGPCGSPMDPLAAPCSP